MLPPLSSHLDAQVHRASFLPAVSFRAIADLLLVDVQIGLQKLAKELQVTIFVGIHDLPEPGSDEDQGEEEGSERVFNTHVAIDPKGDVVAYYRKVNFPSFARWAGQVGRCLSLPCFASFTCSMSI